MACVVLDLARRPGCPFVNARLHRDEIAFLLEHSGASLVIVDDADDVASLVGSLESLKDLLGAPGYQRGQLLIVHPLRSPTARTMIPLGSSTPAARPVDPGVPP